MMERIQYIFADAVFLPEENRLVIAGEEHVLEQKVADLLHAFCRRPGQILTKAWLLEEIWPDRLVNEDSLSVAVSKLRRTLGDQRGKPRFIKTITGTGYRWLPDVSRRAASAAGAAPRAPASNRRLLPAILLLLVVLAGAALGWLVLLADGEETGPQLPERLTAVHAEAEALLESSADAEQLRQAISHYRRIIEEQPGFLDAYLGIAEAKLELSALNGHLDIELYVDEVHALLDHVLGLDPDNARAWLRKGEISWLGDWDLRSADRAYRNAIRLAPDDSENYLPYTEFLISQGKFGRAEAVMVQLRATNPDHYRFLNMSYIHLMRGELELALAETQRLFNSETGADQHRYHKMLHRVGLLLGHQEMAFESLRWLLREQQFSPRTLAELEGLYRVEGMAGLFQRFLADELDADIGHYRPPISLARYAVVAGAPDAALDWLDRAIEERQPQALFIDIDPHYLPLRNRPRFQELIQRLPGRVDQPVSQ